MQMKWNVSYGVKSEQINKITFEWWSLICLALRVRLMVPRIDITVRFHSPNDIKQGRCHIHREKKKKLHRVIKSPSQHNHIYHLTIPQYQDDTYHQAPTRNTLLNHPVLTDPPKHTHTVAKRHTRRTNSLITDINQRTNLYGRIQLQ